MTSTDTGHDGRLQELDAAECWQHLTGRTVGQIAYVDRGGPVVLPLNYAVHDGAVWLRTASYNQLALHLPGQTVAFHVSHTDEHDHTGWSVLVRGRAEHVLPADPAAPRGDVAAMPWAGGTRSMVFRLTPSEVTGRVLRQGDVTPDVRHGPGTVQRH
jgi:hypothetical protein